MTALFFCWLYCVQIMKILGVITARGGSKGIPGKNIKLLCGKPLIWYTIDAAKKSGVFDRIILSTDDKKIAEVAKSYGVEVPFMRPQELAEDKTPHLPVLQHAVKFLEEKESYKPDCVMILQPTAPLRQSFHIVESVDLLKNSGADSVVGVTELPTHYYPYWAVTASDNGWASLFVGAPIRERIPRRQEFPKKVYAHNGSIYLFKTGLLFGERPSLYGDKVKLYPMDEKHNINIDEPRDWFLAELALRDLEDGK